MSRSTTGGGNRPTFSPLIYDYLRRWQEDPTSRVFAPLAEAYRKAGMIDEAIEIAQDGVRIHPKFLGGQVALARALFDRGRYDEVISLLEVPSREAPDNLAAQKILGESFLMTGRVVDALGCYKMYLYFAPMDGEVARLVKELETQAYDQGMLVLRLDSSQPKSPQIGAPTVRSGPRLVHDAVGPALGAGRHVSGEAEDSLSAFSEKPVAGAIDGDPGLRRQIWIDRVERLQKLLQRVERYRSANSSEGQPMGSNF